MGASLPRRLCQRAIEVEFSQAYDLDLDGRRPPRIEQHRPKRPGCCGPCLRSLMALLDRRIGKVEARMAGLVKADPELAGIDRRLQTVPGVGPIVATTLIAELPELGRLDRRKVAALAGLAPIARDSGKRAGRRIIGGGRPVVRTMLFIAALHGSRHDAGLKAFRNRLERAGKPVKAAITATARKRLTVLNAMLAHDTDYRHAALT